MRTAEICPTCATYENAVCVIYNGEYLTNTDIVPLDPLDVVITKINDNLVPKSGDGPPTSSAIYIGQLYVDTGGPGLYYAVSVGSAAADWVLL